MAVVTLAEIIDLIIMVVGIGYIFTGLVKIPYKPGETPQWYSDFLYSTLIAAPGVVLHEAAHKIVAMMLGLQATFHASYFGLGLGLLLKMLTPIIVFVPGYVSISGANTLQTVLTAFAGPFLNLVLALVAMGVLRYHKGLSNRWQIILILTKRLNLFLFAFNLIPIPPFDGHKVFTGLAELLLS